MKYILDINSEDYDYYCEDLLCQYFKWGMKACAHFREFFPFLLKNILHMQIKTTFTIQDYNIFGTSTQHA